MQPWSAWNFFRKQNNTLIDPEHWCKCPNTFWHHYLWLKVSLWWWIQANAGPLCHGLMPPCCWSHQQVLRHFPLSLLCRRSGLIFSMNALWSAKLKANRSSSIIYYCPQIMDLTGILCTRPDLNHQFQSDWLVLCNALKWRVHQFTNEDEFYKLSWSLD